MNKLILVGNLTREIEFGVTNSGTSFANSAIAVNKKRKDREEVMFLDVTFFGKTAEVVQKYLSKGAKVALVGELKQDTWIKRDGSKASKHSMIVSELEMLGGKPQEQYQQQPQQPRQQDDDDVLPF
jgi:single-strand DNA-binding protein